MLANAEVAQGSWQLDSYYVATARPRTALSQSAVGHPPRVRGMRGKAACAEAWLRRTHRGSCAMTAVVSLAAAAAASVRSTTTCRLTRLLGVYSAAPASPQRRLRQQRVSRMAMQSAAIATWPLSAPCCQSGLKQHQPPGKVKAYIALGSNMGDRIGWIEKACTEMDRRGLRVCRTSSLWETEPMYVLEQDKFANGVCEVETELAPLALLDELQDIERSLGRRKLVDKGPRNIDLDILLYGDEKIEDERLTVPHIGMAEREFVLRPLVQLAPGIALDPARPWKLAQDYLNELAVVAGSEPLTPLTPLGTAETTREPLQALRSSRRTRVMAILNVTPDSFSDGGRHAATSETALDALAETVRGFVRDGAAVIDVGGQSTAPGRPEVSVEEELARVVPAVARIRQEHAADVVAISVDTYRAAVAEAAVAAGADMINDVSAGDMDADMLPTVARLGATVCLMHMRGTPATMSTLNDYGGRPSAMVAAVARELLARVAAAEAAGIRRWRIVLDPGLGFAKVGDQNIDVLRHLAELRAWPGLEGLPWLVGSSRKSFIGRTTGVATPAERVWGTAATVAAAVQGGADIVRVHDVREMAQVVAMADAIWRY
ncbi:folic acid synthesis protein [Grosmannia clavigera kw1407]|uniref:Folic acid synthesis protein FOL1 n=1 Tax=Grosmannia clavigera (strain kw1407 / UAMH 11150) TaxID=655863 RepID=F0X956_GROCL|nr:folic acid synthesis protein [Grosmannia clavigera kw1407]EFX06113.1 folic acid synthesis protein [Grosmannia clavigera kw1407]